MLWKPPRRKRSPRDPGDRCPVDPETATPEALRRRPRKQLQHLKARFLSPRRLLPSRPRKQPCRRMLNPQRLKLLLLQRPLSRKRLPPKSAAPATPESAATPENSKTATPKLRPAQNAKSNRSPSCNSGKKQRLLTKKQREPFRKFLKKAGSTVANFFGGLFDKSTG